MKITVFMTIICFASLSQAVDVGFKNGNERTSVNVQGDILVVCQDPMGTQFGNFHCEKDILLPSEFDYFQGPEGVKADEVTLTATREDHSVRSKTMSYDGVKRQSVKEFNLWINTLFQRSLLKLGQSKVDFVIKNRGKVTSLGRFEAFVKDGGTRICRRRGHYQSSVGNDCSVGGSRFCQQFFWENKYCLN